MHYYQFNISDYRAATAHLSNEEDLAYRRLIDMYYDTENKIPKDLDWVARRIRISPVIVRDVLNDMFTLHDDGWHHQRCQEVIAEYHAKAEQASRAGKASAERKRNKQSTDVERSLNGRTTDVQLTINQEPITNNHIQEAKASLSGTSFPPCPHQAIIDLWKRHLPHLAQPRVWEGVRQNHMRNRWIQASKPSDYSPDGYRTTADGLKWWDAFFRHIANGTNLASGFETKGRLWQPDLEWVVNAGNFAKIIDGRYDK
jgi:uncharacterized protein YdaU (DUF1376 family)